MKPLIIAQNLYTIGKSSVTVMGDNLGEKVAAAMLGFHHSGFNPRKLLAKVLHKSEVHAGCIPHHA